MNHLVTKLYDADGNEYTLAKVLDKYSEERIVYLRSDKKAIALIASFIGIIQDQIVVVEDKGSDFNFIEWMD